MRITEPNYFLIGYAGTWSPRPTAKTNDGLTQARFEDDRSLRLAGVGPLSLLLVDDLPAESLEGFERGAFGLGVLVWHLSNIRTEVC